ncbi:MAG TPA: LuxR C-terminal-related transcriptional regulator [Acidimicrobiales bacterium]|nr:LuxR C-terminal-related transcriptional regulator [Acidimicrobiales bacterium]
MLTKLLAPVSSFVGRHDERAELAEVIATCRLVTLTGGPGAGKSRLALEVARTAGQTVAYANLAPGGNGNGNANVHANANRNGNANTAPSLDRVAADLDAATTLLVLDNADHVLDACRALVGEVLSTRPDLHVLLTSREALAAPEEAVWRVRALATPPADVVHTLEELAAYDSVALFTARANALRAEFELDAGNAGPVADICRRLEGNPLALELAAGRAGVLSANEIAEHLATDRHDEDLFEPSRTAPVRHRSLTAAVAWSHGLLTQSEGTLLRRLSVFSGGFDLEAARDVCAGAGLPRPEISRHLARLVAKSLVDTEPPAGATAVPARPGTGATGAPSRFWLTDADRRYAYNRLVEAGEAAERQALHAAWCVVFVSATNSHSHGHGNGQQGDQDERWLNRLEAEYDNVCAAFGWAVDQGRAKLALRLARGQMLFWQMSGRFGEARKWLEKVLKVSKEAPAPLRASALHDAGYVAMLLGDFPAARSHLEESVKLFAKWPHSKGQSSARTMLGFVVSFSADRQGLQLLEQTLAQARVAGDDNCVFETLVAYGRARLFRGAPTVAEHSFHEAAQVATHLGEAAVIATIGLGWAALAQGRYDQANAHLTEALALARHTSDAHATAVALMWSGELARRRGHYAEARPLLDEARRVALAMGTPYPLATSLLGLARLSLAEGDTAASKELFDDQLGLARRSGLAFLVAPGLVGLAQSAWIAGDLPQARNHLKEALEVAYDYDDRWGVAEALHARGWVARAGGHNAKAAAFHHRALGLQQEIGDAPGVVASLEALAGLAAQDGATEVAAVVFGAAAAIRAARGFPRSPLEEQPYGADVALLEQTIGTDQLQAAWQEGGSMSLADAVAYASRDAGLQARPTTGWASLSPAECEVAALVQEALTNREIAQRLLLSTETVKSHLSAVFSKLGISSRQELAQAVRQRTQEPDDG